MRPRCPQHKDELKISIIETDEGFVEVWKCPLVTCGYQIPVTVEIKEGRLIRK